MPPIPREAWRAQAEATVTTIAQWRDAHPRATWAELEAAVDGQLAGLRTRLLAAGAQASPAADPARTERPDCPACGGVLHDAGRHRRRLTTEGGQTVVLERTYLRCPACGAGLFPPR
ncbi:MAG: YgiT-type zinc finger protein [Thermomicrobiales bacterium]